MNLQPAFDQLAQEMGMNDARRMAQERVRTRVPNPYATVHALQAAGRKYPDLQGVVDDAITAILVYSDKMSAARSCLNDVWEAE